MRDRWPLPPGLVVFEQTSHSQDAFGRHVVVTCLGMLMRQSLNQTLCWTSVRIEMFSYKLLTGWLGNGQPEIHQGSVSPDIPRRRTNRPHQLFPESSQTRVPGCINHRTISLKFSLFEFALATHKCHKRQLNSLYDSWNSLIKCSTWEWPARKKVFSWSWRIQFPKQRHLRIGQGVAVWPLNYPFCQLIRFGVRESNWGLGGLNGE